MSHHFPTLTIGLIDNLSKRQRERRERLGMRGCKWAKKLGEESRKLKNLSSPIE